MTFRFSIELILHGIPTVRHIRDIEESIRLSLRSFCSNGVGGVGIQSAEVNPGAAFAAGDLMTVRFSVELEVREVEHERRLRNVEESIRRSLSLLCCQRDDALLIQSRDELRIDPATEKRSAIGVSADRALRQIA